VQVEAEEIGGADRCRSLLADVTSPADCEQVVATAIATFGSIYGLINNAGRGMRLISETFNVQPTRFWEADPQAWRTIIDTNINGTFQMARAATPHLVEQGRGMIVNISTSPVTMIRRGYSPYGPSKAALEACSAAWAQDLDGSGVCVNVLLPGGATDTALLPGSGPGRRGADGQLLEPKIMAPPAVWLCSDDARRYTGRRFVAKHWKPGMSKDEGVQAALQPEVTSPSVT
jgi:3-oxoacyl-[acyl-carrier protein] reductase